MLAIADNFFAQFALPVGFEINSGKLNARYRELQAQVHPDRFAAAGEARRLQAIQLSSYLNEAYETLQSPLRRAGYLLRLQGIDVERVVQSDLAPELLFEQMELRESLAELPENESAFDQLDELNRKTANRLAERQGQFVRALAGNQLEEARKLFHELQFLHKFQMEIHKKEESLESVADF